MKRLQEAIKEKRWITCDSAMVVGEYKHRLQIEYYFGYLEDKKYNREDWRAAYLEDDLSGNFCVVRYILTQREVKRVLKIEQL